MGLAIMIAFAAGMLVTLSRQLNGRLAMATSALGSSFRNHLVGLGALTLYALVTGSVWPADVYGALVCLGRGCHRRRFRRWRQLADPAPRRRHDRRAACGRTDDLGSPDGPAAQPSCQRRDAARRRDTDPRGSPHQPPETTRAAGSAERMKMPGRSPLHRQARSAQEAGKDLMRQGPPNSLRLVIPHRIQD